MFSGVSAHDEGYVFFVHFLRFKGFIIVDDLSKDWKLLGCGGIVLLFLC